jgi:hypothetical protein
MRKMILSVISAVLIAGSASAADAAHHRRAVSKTAERPPTGAPFRNSNNAIAPAPQANCPIRGTRLLPVADEDRAGE